MSNTIQSLVKLAEMFEADGMPEYAKQIEDIIKAVAEDKLDTDAQDENKE
jgi:hypothetical protein